MKLLTPFKAAAQRLGFALATQHAQERTAQRAGFRSHASYQAARLQVEKLARRK